MQHLVQGPVQVSFVGTPGRRLSSAGEDQFVCRPRFWAAVELPPSDPCRPHQCWLSQSQQSETSPQSPPHWPPCNYTTVSRLSYSRSEEWRYLTARLLCNQREKHFITRPQEVWRYMNIPYCVRSALPWDSRTRATWRSEHFAFASSTHMFLVTPWALAS